MSFSGKISSLEKDFSLSKAALIIGGSTLVAKLIALFRDPLIVAKLGVGGATDAYFAAFRIPDFIFQLLVLGTLSVAFIPIFSAALVKDRRQAFNIANSVLNAAVIIMAAICFILFVFAGPLVKLLVPGFTPEKFHLALALSRLFLLSPIIFTVSSVFTSILTSFKKFLALSLAPVFYNLGIIFGLFVFYPRFGLMGLGYGVVLGALLHLSVQIPQALSQGWRWSAVLNLKEPAVRKIGKLFLPRIIGMDISQISLLIGTSIGSLLAAGSVTIFTNAINLETVPLGVFALSISSASFPLLSELYAKKEEKKFLETLTANIQTVLFFIIPSVILMVIFRAYIVRIIYGHGKFNWDDTIAMFSTFGILSFSLLGQSLSPLFSRAFYARHNTIIPVMVNVVSIITNACLTWYWGQRWGLAGVASAFTFACILDALLMFSALRWQLLQDNLSLAESDKSLMAFLAKIISASAAMGLVSYSLIYALAPLLNTRTFWGILVQAGLSALIGIFIFLACANLLGLKQVKRVESLFKKIF